VALVALPKVRQKRVPSDEKALRVAGRFARFHERQGGGGQGGRRRSRPEASEARMTGERREDNARRKRRLSRRSGLDPVKDQGLR